MSLDSESLLESDSLLLLLLLARDRVTAALLSAVPPRAEACTSTPRGGAALAAVGLVADGCSCGGCAPWGGCAGAGRCTDGGGDGDAPV